MHPTAADLRGLAATLRAAHGDKPLTPGGDPLAELILTVLSQATNDRNRDRAFAALRAALPEWDDVAGAPVEHVERAIAPGGLAKNKAPRIQAIIRAVGGADALKARLREAPQGAVTATEPTTADNIAYLCSLPGVGPKTAACTLLFALGQPAFPVDTHVHRIALRLGLVSPKSDAVKTQTLLNEALAGWSPADLYDLHVNLIDHGRRYCRPGNPHCADCPLLADCAHGQAATATASAGTAPAPEK